MRILIAFSSCLFISPALADDGITEEDLAQAEAEAFVLDAYRSVETPIESSLLLGRVCDGRLKCFFKNAPHIAYSVKCYETGTRNEACEALCPTFYQVSFEVRYEFERAEGGCDWVTPSSGSTDGKE